MKGVTPAQLRKIHICARECGMDDELLHLAVKDLTGRSSLKDLTLAEACHVIDTMEGRPGTSTAGDGATPKQVRYMNDLMKQLGWMDEDGEPDMARLDGMCKKYAKVDSHKWLSRKGAGNIIEALKKMLERQKTQAAAH